MFLGHTVGYCVFVVQGKYGENIEDHYDTGQVKWVNNLFENFKIGNLVIIIIMIIFFI